MKKHKKAKVAVQKKAKKISKPAAKKPVKLKAKPAPAKTKPVAKEKPAKTAPEAVVEVLELPKMLKIPKADAIKYKKLLLDLRDHLIDGVNFLANDNLKRTSRDVSGELSGYSLHMADAGSDNFDREFALSLVSSEQDALYEIEEAIKRLEQGTYGLCETCEKPVRKERLEAVPFARMCVQCQSIREKDKGRRPAPVGALFSEAADDDAKETEETEE